MHYGPSVFDTKGPQLRTTSMPSLLNSNIDNILVLHTRSTPVF